MTKETTAASPQSQQTQPSLSGGLYLRGTVIAIRTEEKEWEGKKYTQTTIEVSDGEKTYSIRHKHDGAEFKPPALFTSICLRVLYAATEKGHTAVRGIFV